MAPNERARTGSDILMDGEVTAAYWYGELAPDERPTSLPVAE